MTRPSSVGITMGDPAGVGPEIVCRALADLSPADRAGIVVFGTKSILERANKLTGRWAVVRRAGFGFVTGSRSGRRYSHTRFGVGPRRHNDRRCRGLQLRLYRARCFRCARGRHISDRHRPDQQGSTARGRLPVRGSYGAAAHLTGATSSFMLLASERLSTIHVSTHVSLAGAVQRATMERELATIRVGNAHLKRLGIARPRIAVAGLNPHSGENGLFGTDEIERIKPAIEAARSEGIAVTGPISGDTVFYRALQGEFDLVVAQYHDQGHVPTKLIAFDTTVDVSLGLPICAYRSIMGPRLTLLGRASRVMKSDRHDCLRASARTFLTDAESRSASRSASI